MNGIRRTQLGVLLATALLGTPLGAQDNGFALAGLWFDPARDGEGFNVVQSDAGLTIYYYGYDNEGEQLWLITETTPVSITPGDATQIPMVAGEGGTFDAPVSGAQLPRWGTLSITVGSCSSARFELDGRDGVKRSDVVQLAAVEGNECRVRAESTRATTYCDIRLFYLRPDDLADVDVWSTRSLDDECPVDLFQALDAEAIQAEFSAAGVGLNGPRQTLFDVNDYEPVGSEVRDFGGIPMVKLSTLVLNPNALSGDPAYNDLDEQRRGASELWAGSEVYELISDRNLKYVMTSLSKRVDPGLTVDNLATLGERLNLPNGWTWSTRILESDLRLPSRDQTTLVLDEFENTYQRIEHPGAFRVAGLWFDEARDGEGFNVIQSAAGTTIYFYGYDDSGEALWLVSDTVDGVASLNETQSLAVYRGVGGTFEDPVPGADLNAWGSIALTPQSCSNITFELTGVDGSKLTETIKLAGITGNNCSEFLPPGDYAFTMSYDGLPRSYDLHVPPGYDGAARPLLVDFHGLGGSVSAQRQRNLGLSDETGFLLAVPKGSGAIPSWSAGNCCPPANTNGVDDVGFARAVVADIAARTAIDSKRVYATGSSNGGALSHVLACEAADVFAAIAPTAFVLPLDDCSPSRPITVAHFHGLSDTVVPYAGGASPRSDEVRIGAIESHETWARINDCPGPPARVFEQGGSYCDAYESCAGGVINVLCSVDAGHTIGRNSDIDVVRAAWEFISGFSLP